METILIVDDSPSSLAAEAELLGRIPGCKVETAHSGKEGIQKAKHIKPEIIVLDVLMREMDGYATCTRLKQIPETADIPVVFLTATNNDKDIMQGFKVGGVDYIPKTLNPDIQRTRIETHLKLVRIRHKLDRELEKKKHLVHKLSLEIEHRKKVEMELQEEKRYAEKVNQYKSIFLSGMSHDLRTPMNSILGFAQLMKLDGGTTLKNHQIEYIDYIINGGQHLLGLINNVLDLAKLEAGKWELEPEKIDLNQFLSEIYAMNEPAAGKRKLNFSVEKKNENYFIWADIIRLKQIFMNLISNAIIYNYEGGDVSITLEKINHEMIRIFIEDTGPGVGDDKVPDLFKPFKRLGMENSGIKGTGIGLNIAKKLAESMGGKIGYTGKKTDGSIFWVDMPRYREFYENTVLSVNEQKNLDKIRSKGKLNEYEIYQSKEGRYTHI
jgi:signal transduction histidine kinase